MDVISWFSINNILVNIPLGKEGYPLSWIEAIGTIAGLLCIWLASQEKIINYLFGLINVTLFAIIFSRSSYMPVYCYKFSSLLPIFMVGMHGVE